MHERDPGKMGVHDLVHLGVRPDLEEGGQVALDLGQRPARRNFEHESRVGEQRAVPDCRDEGVGRALDQFEPDGAAVETGAEEILDVAQQRREHAFQIVVIVDAIFARSPLMRGEGREFAGDPQQRFVKALGMDVFRRAKMLERRDFAVEALQDQIVGALQAAAGGRVARVARKLVELVADPADDAVEPAFDGRMRGADEHRRRELLVEHQGAVMHLDDARDREADIARLRGLADLVSEARISDLDFLLDAEVRGGIDHRLGADHVAGGVFRLLGADLAKIVGARRHGEPDQLAGGRLRRRDRRGRRTLGGKVEQPAVRHDARRPAQRELALLGKIPVDLERRESPGIGRYMARAAFERVFEIAVALLKMVRPKKQALRPMNFRVP